MTVNVYVKNWCDEHYDVRKEDFYVENAYYVAEREWAISGLKHGLFALAIAIATLMTTGGDILSALVNLGILTACFWFYGIRSYDANSMETSIGFYIMMAILLFVTKSKVSNISQIIFTIPTIVLYIYLTFVQPIRFIKTAIKMKKRIQEEESEEEQGSKQSYTKWEEGYKAFRYGLPEPEQETPHSDPNMIEAKKLFEGYTDTQQMLKTRYRQLAKQYHPDRGGDTKLFQCIISVYETINQTFV